MKNLTTYLLLGVSLSMPLTVMAAPDLNDVTMDVINLDDSHADAVMKQIDLPSMAERGEQERDDHSRSTKVNGHNDLSVKEREMEGENKMSQERVNEMERENQMEQERNNEMERENQMEQERDNEMERENTTQQEQQLDRDTDHGVNDGDHSGMSSGGRR